MTEKKFQDFVDNQFFVDWVKNPTMESDRYWQQYVADHPSEKEYIDQAKYLIERFQKEKREPGDEDIKKVWLNISEKMLNPPQKIRSINNIWWAAASIILIVGLSATMLFRLATRNSSVDYISMAKIESEGNEVKLILADNSEKRFASKDPSIKYNKQGDILLDSLTLSNNNSTEVDKKEVFNQLVVPKGKRSSLTFSDGTRLYLNSGSQVIYPVTFNKKSREIYIRGEAYMEVTHNKNWPFIVKTDNLDVKVMGTEFNIISYPDESNSTVVLVKGSVQAIVNSQKVLMKENELFTLDKATKNISLGEINVLEYISWKDGWLYCTNERIDNIAKKLSRYYDIDIRFNDSKVKDMTLTGKLDLKTEYKEIFNVISFIAPVDHKIVDGSIILSSKLK